MSTLTPVPPAGPAMLVAGTAAGLSDHAPGRAENRALGILLDDARAGRPVHVEHIPAGAAGSAGWPQWAPDEVIGAFADRGIRAPWSHQAQAADHAGRGPRT